MRGREAGQGAGADEGFAVRMGEVVEAASIGNLPLNGHMLIDLVLTVPRARESPRSDRRYESAALAARTVLSREHRVTTTSSGAGYT